MRLFPKRGKTSAKVILASRNCGVQSKPIIYTLELMLPNVVFNEFMTHCIFEKNTFSARAKGGESYSSFVWNNFWYPLVWREDCKGMSPEKICSEIVSFLANTVWIFCFFLALILSKFLGILGIHKELRNRPLYPFGYTKVVMTATEYGAFFKQRLPHYIAYIFFEQTHILNGKKAFYPKGPQLEMQELAARIQEAMKECSIQDLKEGEWHIPYVTEEEEKDLEHSVKLCLSVGRCGRVSYGNQGKIVDVSKDIDFHERELREGHFSPFCHQAVAQAEEKLYCKFYGFKAYRKIITGESFGDRTTC